MPLNRDRSFDVWPPFDPGVWIEINPAFVRLSPDVAWAVVCRYGAVPEPGRSSIWAVRVDGDMRPLGKPVQILAHGIDPRIVMMGERILVFYAAIERNEADLVCGSTVVLADFSIENDTWTCAGTIQFPKNPIVGPMSADSVTNWEKNWVPFKIDDGRVGLIYSHEPWDIIVLNVESRHEPKFESVIRGPGLHWDYGTIRGGTPPVVYDECHLVTFFHSGQTIGSRRVYSAGAVVFEAKAPFTPVLMTHQPLLMAPYKSNARRFGWPNLSSVVFPLGAEATPAGYNLLCGRDDGEVASFLVEHDLLAARLKPPTAPHSGALHDYRDRGGMRVALSSLVYVPDPMPGIPDLPMVVFLKTVAGQGRTFVDVGAQIGFYTMALAPGYDKVVAFEPQPGDAKWFERNRALNGYDHVICERVALGDGLAARLDAHHMSDVDLLKIECGDDGLRVLAGAETTIRSSRPVMLIVIGRDHWPALEAMTNALDYTAEAMFPLSPITVLCIPRERRHIYDWFI